MTLSTLTPAEVILLKYGSKAPLRQLLKYTFADLLVKQVIKLHRTEQQHNYHDRARILKYIHAGERFNDYTWQDHEDVFLNIFVTTPDIQVLFKNLLQIAQTNAGSPAHYRKMVRQSPRLANVFEVSFLDRILGNFRHTTEGTGRREQLSKEIQDLEANLPDILKNDRQKALEIIRSLGGNIFLLRGIDLELLREIDAALAEATPVLYDDTDYTTIGLPYYSFGSDNDNDHSAHHHNESGGDWGDSGCSSDSSGGDSGCSSGCSGCGGSSD